MNTISASAPQASTEDMRNAAPGFGLDADQLEHLRVAGLTPDEVAGVPEVQHARVLERLHWFARLALGRANPKWAVPHAYELAYYLTTEDADRGIDLEAIKNASYLDGVNISAVDRGILERPEKIEPAAQPTRPCSCPSRDGYLRPCPVHPRGSLPPPATSKEPQ